MNLKGDHCLRFPGRLIIAIRVYLSLEDPAVAASPSVSTSGGLSRLVISKYDRFLGNAGNAQAFWILQARASQMGGWIRNLTERRSSRRHRFEALQERHLGHFRGDVLMEIERM